MKKTKILSLLLCLSLFCALIVPCTKAYAKSDPDSGMKISKTATANGDGSYTITLEAFATGSKTTTVQEKDIPTDIILVLDQSGSMEDDIGQVRYTAYTGNNTQNKSNYEKRHNGGSANLWHKLPDGSYVSVSVTKTTTYKELGSLVNYETSWGSLTTDCYYYYMNNLYEKVGDEYKKVTIKVKKGGLFEKDTFIYTFSDGTTVSSKGNSSKPNFGSHAPLYTPTADGTNTVYTYTYTDSTGAVQTIGTSTGANTRFTTVFYQRSTTTTGGGSRLAALKKAANSFVDAVAKKAQGTDGKTVDHRIAVVGYASSASNLTSGFKSMSDSADVSSVHSVIDGLKADGGTLVDKGISTANSIFQNNPLQEKEERNRVMIVFTDGAPGTYGNWGSMSVDTANQAISNAKAAKQTYGATVYTIGIFSGADASNPNSLPAYTKYTTSFWGEEAPSDADQVKNSNRFMHLVSSNYPNATSITDPGAINSELNGKSYYLSADDAASLNNIFQQISSNIESGGSSSPLTETSVVKDIISPQFTLPEGATASDITLETWKCTGKDGDAYTWSKNTDAMGAQATIASTDNTHATTTNNQVSVTGFNFSENYVGTVTENGNTTYRGNKLVIKFNVKLRDGFLGGNGVYTNTSAGVYENASATEPVLPFDRPQTDVTIKEPKITLPDANVYLGAYFSETVNAEDLKKGTKIKFGENIELDLSKPDDNWGLEAWQTEYVNNIEVKVTDKEGNEVTDFAKLTDDTQYKVSVSIKPKTLKEGNDGWDKDMTGTIHVFKPELTFKDSTVEYRKTVVTGYEGNKVSEAWKSSDGIVDSEATMLTSKPTLTLTYTPEAGSLDYTGLVISTEDIPVKVDVALNGSDEINGVPVTDYTTFVHQPCTTDCGWTTPATPGNPAFRLHVKDVYADLTITKTGANETADPGQSFLFTVTGPDNYSTEVIIVGNDSVTLKNLKIGTYTVAENTGWSWRYRPKENDKEITLVANQTNTVTIENERKKDQWLDGNVHTDNKFTGAAATTD